ncbi:hypothetical protein BTUL_0039g00440 [Botrytis tulipae]|uniref:Uncharacterized protein n=1 Tax=Botrytis tulipae TaxID=87230 RepID=A0A4Z1F314_9HELO|nr:hypothetical protein BTUL_0039g00440 [Botrytis tulipae]
MDRSTRNHSGGASSGGNGRDERGGDKQNRGPYRDATGDKPNQKSDGKAGGSHGDGSSGSDEKAAAKKPKQRRK